jgi:primosomal protein N' (replication factor Y)
VPTLNQSILLAMNYYTVWVGSTSFRKEEPLTYAYESPIRPRTVVKIPLQHAEALGIVVASVTKPRFPTRKIIGVIGVKPLPKQLLDLIDWLSAYYPANRGSILLSCLPSTLLSQTTRTRHLEPVTHTHDQDEDKPLTQKQEQALEKILSVGPSSILLHGDTGSGKTRIYTELAQQCVTSGRSALILTPEIGLTAQLSETFKKVFGSQVLVYHSQLTPNERRHVWHTLLEAKQPYIVIGPRSALFTPIKNIGLIVMDEAHESAFKQEQSPYYQTSRVAATLAKLHKGYFLMGTATPLVSDYYFYKQKDLPIIRLDSPAIKSATPPSILLVPLGKRELFTNSMYISEPLRRAIDQSLKSDEQSLIFLNRRGSARIVLCQKCGWQAVCPRCDIGLTFHADHHELLCHTCGYRNSVPTSCPACNNTDITFRSAGTKTIVAELSRLYPNARIGRFDTDNRKHERIEHNYEAIRTGQVDILVGTQMLSKGLDLPLLSVIGVIQADTGLFIPDYTADEVTYQQVVQIIGRVGRGHRTGQVVIQSQNPENIVIQAAIKRNYKLFYESQIKERRLYDFPPFTYLLKLTTHRPTAKASEANASKFKELLQSLNLPLEVIGPSPAFHEKRSGRYYWQLIVKSSRRTTLLEVIRQLPPHWSYDIDPATLL